MTEIKNFTNKYKLQIILGLIILFFVLIHIPGLHLPYHQDEYKWPMYANPQLSSPGAVPHPPLTGFIYGVIGNKIGYDNFRFIPFFFGMLNIFLVFYLAKTVFDKKTAIVVTSLFAVSFYSLLATLMVDVDGAVMPFFLLLMFIGYYKFKEKDFSLNSSSWKWFALLCLGALGGFLIKVIFAVPIAVLAFDFALEKNTFSDKKKIYKAILYGFMGIIALVLVLVLAKFVFPFFRLEYALKYWEHFANFGYRNWFQTFIQFAKSVLYTSPLLLVPLFFINKEILRKTRPFLIFLITEIVFYLIIFDFSGGALDRYFQFMIIPLCVISGEIIYSVINSGEHKRNREYIFLGVIAALIILLSVFLPHFVPSLHPKSEWLSRIFSLKWNFLYPFSGGSGPLGFYVSFLFMALAWISSIVLVVIRFVKPHLRKMAILIILPIGLIYNGVFTEEYLFGGINGSAPKLLYGAVEYIKNNPNIDKVVTYNDNGGHELQNIGKYSRRLYADPAFEENYKDFFKTFSGYILYIDIPRIDPSSFYLGYFNSCDVIYSQTDKSISATVYDCTKILKK